jgi:hypothetical protein
LANVDNFTNHIKQFKNILFISTDYPCYGGAATNCYNLMKYYEDLGHKTFGLFLCDDEKVQIKNNDKNVSIVNTIMQVGGNLNRQEKYYGQLRLELKNIIPIQTITKYFEDKVDLIILRNYCDINVLKEYFDCKYYFLVPGLFSSTLDKRIEKLKTKSDYDKYINPKILDTISKADQVYVNGNITKHILEKYYEIETEILYFNDVTNITDDNTTQVLCDSNKKYLLGVVISDFKRKIKNIKDIRSLFEKFPNDNKIAIGRNSSMLSDIENTTCLDLMSNDDVKTHLQKIKIIVNTSYYEGHSNVIVEAINSGCNVLKYQYLKKQFDYDVKDLNEMITKINDIKSEKPIVSGLLLKDNMTNVDKLCINSFIKNGEYIFNLYSYNYANINDKIDGCNILDANDIVKYDQYLKNKNLFKYKVLYNTGGLWTDMGMVWLQNKIILRPYFFINHNDEYSYKLIKFPKESNIMRLCLDGLMPIEDLVKDHNIDKYCVDRSLFLPLSSDQKIMIPIKNAITLNNEWYSIHIDESIINTNELTLGSLYLELLSKYVFTLSVFCCATEPISNSYPIYESIVSFLNLVDEVIVVYGRDETISENVLNNLSPKIKIIKTNNWPIEWDYNVMTNHFNVGMKACTGDIAFKIDIDYICRCDDLNNYNEMRQLLFSHINKYHVIQMPRINYYANGHYSFCVKMGPYIINKKLLEKDKKTYYIGIKGYSNTICVDEDYNEVVVENYDYAVVNYDCSFMNIDQYLKKQYYWFMAYYKKFGTLERFKITPDDIKDKTKLLNFCMERMFARRTMHYEKRGYDLNPTIIREKIKNLTSDQFGKSYFDMKNFSQLIKFYEEIEKLYKLKCKKITKENEINSQKEISLLSFI